jgi:hypothetical protein
VWEAIRADNTVRTINMGQLYGDWTGDEKAHDEHDCPVSKRHETGFTIVETSIELYGRDNPIEFLPMVTYGADIVSKQFADKLKGSRLTGFALHDGVTIADNCSDREKPEFLLLDVVGSAGFCRRWQVHGGPNLCPYCEKEPLVCSGCGLCCSRFGCPRCKKRVHYFAGDERKNDGKNFLFDLPPDVWVVDGEDWDGSDWLAMKWFEAGAWFVNRRAKEWFERTRCRDISFKPAMLNIEGMDPALIK